MGRLIDADALKDTIHIHQYILRDQHNSFDNGMFTCGIDQAIDEAPTADAVEVVRCKNCKHYRSYAPYLTRHREDGWCDVRRMTDYGEININVKEDDFCSFGERREG